MWGGLRVKSCAAKSTSQKSGSTSRYEWEALEFQTYVGDVSGEGTANVRSIVDAGIWGAEISVFERKSARTRGLDPCARCSSFNQFRWENGASPLKVAMSKLSPVGWIVNNSMTASVTGDVAEKPLYSQVGCGLKLYLMAKVWYKVGESRFHLVEHVEKVLRQYLISLKSAYQRLKCAFGATTWRLMWWRKGSGKRDMWYWTSREWYLTRKINCWDRDSVRRRMAKPWFWLHMSRIRPRQSD